MEVNVNTKTQSFMNWMLENMHSNHSNKWRQIGLWTFTLSVAVFVVPRVV